MGRLLLILLFISSSAHAAEFLIYNRDYTCPEGDLCYEKGDIVEVFEDGKLGPYAHANGKFKVIKVPGMTLEEGRAYSVGHFDEMDDKKTKGRRRFKFDLKKLAKEAQDDLDKPDKTYVASSFNQVKSQIYDKKEKKGLAVSEVTQ